MEGSKEYYAKIKKEIEPYQDVIYYEPMEEDEVLDLEKKWKFTFRPIFRQFLLEFGMIQDVVKKLEMDISDMDENMEWLKSSEVENFIPIKTKLKENSDVILALSNDVKEKDNIYEIEFGWDEKLKKIRKTNKTFKGTINKAVNKLNRKKRCKNIDKIRVTEFTIFVPNLKSLLNALKDAKVKQLTKWEDKYYPENPFGDQIAKFEMFEMIRTQFQRDEMKTTYILELEEPILMDKQYSLIEKTAMMLEESNLEFERINSNFIELE